MVCGIARQSYMSVVEITQKKHEKGNLQNCVGNRFWHK